MTILLDDSAEAILVLDGLENTVKVIQQFYSKINNVSNLVTDANGPQAIVKVREYREILENLIKRGVKRRLITEITPKNLPYCKQLVNLLDLRHLEGLKGNFAVSETEYMASAILHATEPIAQIIYSNAKAIVDQHQYLFSTLWNKAVPSEQRIRELEQGVQPEFVEVINDKNRASELLLLLSKSAKKEVLFFLPNDKALVRMNNLGVLDALQEASLRGVDIRVICPITDANSEIVEELKVESRIEFAKGNESQSGIMIIDSLRFISAELVNPAAERFSEAIGITLHSNSKRTISLLRLFFGSLWKQVELYEQLRLAKDKLEVQDRMQREFINVAAHELRTPIQPILGMADLIESKFPEGNNITMTKEDFSLITRNARRLERLSSDILEVAKIESGIMQLNKESFNMRDMILTAIKDVKRQDQMNDKVKIDYELTDLFVEADRDKIFQVISNFLTNAIKFTKEGVVSIHCQREGNHAIVTVRDTGTGIDNEIMPRLFTKFATRSERGTGLGLYISKNIIEAHGGKIRAHNNSENKGATFTFILPIGIDGKE